MSTLTTAEVDPEAGCTISGLRVGLTGRGIDVVDNIDLVLHPGEVVGLVGESGSGKTTVGTALLGYSRRGAEIETGSVLLGTRDVLSMSTQEVRSVRGMEIAYMPQDPASALNPAIRIGRQIVELLELRNVGTAAERLERAKAGLAEVGLPNDEEFLARFPHQLSGGQVQRVALAMAFLPRPKVLVLDEPTTGLDVTTQGMVLATMAELCRSHDVAALYVTHDLAVVANIANRVAVMYAGRIIELGPREAIFRNPAHPYTRALLDAIPHLSQARALVGIPGRTPGPGRRPAGCRFHDRCAYVVERCRTEEPPPVEVAPDHVARCWRIGDIGEWDINRGTVPDTDPNRKREPLLSVSNLNIFYGHKHVVHDVSFDLAKAEVLALVGESGSGKTTISRSIGGLHDNWTGDVNFLGHELAKSARRRTMDDRKRIQYIFQNPYLSLNPRLTIEQIVKRPMELFGLARGQEATDRVVELLEQVALGPTVLKYQTNRLSGGERQRVAIARALAVRTRSAHLRRDHLCTGRLRAGLHRRSAGAAPGRPRHQHAVRHAQPGPGAFYRCEGAGAQRGSSRRVGLRGPGDGPPARGVHQAPDRQLSLGGVGRPTSTSPAQPSRPAQPRRPAQPQRGGSPVVETSADEPAGMLSRLGFDDAPVAPGEDAAPNGRFAEVPATTPRPWPDGEGIDLSSLSVPALGRYWSLSQLNEFTYGTSLVVLVDGCVQYEWYATGRSSGTRFPGASMTKSVLSQLVALALADGALTLDDDVARHVPELARSGYARVRVGQLLTMTSGVDWVEDYRDPDGPAARLLGSFLTAGSPASRTLLTQIAPADPAGSRFEYCTADSQVLDWVRESVTGTTFVQALGRLWRDLGSTTPATVLLDADGVALAGGGLAASALDWARVGSLQLTGHLGQARLSPEWLAAAGRPASPVLRPGRLPVTITSHAGFGYHWWPLVDDGRRLTADGSRGQFTYLDRDAGVVVVKTSDWPYGDPWRDRACRDLCYLALPEIARAARELTGSTGTAASPTTATTQGVES